MPDPKVVLIEVKPNGKVHSEHADADKGDFLVWYCRSKDDFTVTFTGETPAGSKSYTAAEGCTTARVKPNAQGNGKSYPYEVAFPTGAKQDPDIIVW